METSKAKKTKKSQNSPSEPPKEVLISDAYIDYVLMNGHEPHSVYQFMKTQNLSEAEFYENYNSFSALEKSIWKGMAEETIARIKGEKVYGGYMAREKLLAFYFTLIEVLKPNRSFVFYSFRNVKQGELKPAFLKDFRTYFLAFVNDVLREAKETAEVVERPLVSNRYDEGLWLQLMFVINFWLKDDSHAFEKTDAAIEKAVNFSFDLMGKSVLDSFLDFGKFIYQNK